jgi:3-oxoadipate enol-lactonase
MPFIDFDNTRFHYRFDGPSDAPVIVFSNSLGTNLEMWDPQIPALADRFRVLRYDTRGHGLTSVTPGPYSITQLGRDVLGLLDALEIEEAHFCGLSMGGMTGLWLGVYAAQQIKSLVLCNTAAKIGTAEVWNTRIAIVQKGGMAAVTEAVLQRWFSPSFSAAAPDRIEWMRQMLLRTPGEGYAANCAAIRDMDQRETISRIRVPTLVVVGASDPVTTPADGRFIVESVPGAQFTQLDAAHLSNIEAAPAFTQTLLKFLDSVP